MARPVVRSCPVAHTYKLFRPQGIYSNNSNMKVIIALLALVAAVAADSYAPAPYKQSYQPAYKPAYQPAYKPSYKPSYQPSYQQPSYKPSYQPAYHQPAYKPSYQPSYQQPSYSYAPTEYRYDAPAYDYYGGHANTYVNRQPYSVQYDLNEYGPYGSSQYVNFEQTFGQGYKGYH